MIVLFCLVAKWSSGRLRASNFQIVVWVSPWVVCKQPWAVANLLYAQVNSASYPQQDGKDGKRRAVGLPLRQQHGKWVVAYRLRGEGLVWMIGAVVCLPAALGVQLFAGAGSGWPHNALRYRQQLMPILRLQSVCWVTRVTHLINAVPSNGPFLRATVDQCFTSKKVKFWLYYTAL